MIYRFNDVFFSYILGRKEQKPVLIDFLNSMLYLDDDENYIVDLDYHHKEFAYVFKLSAKLNNGIILNIQIDICEDEYYYFDVILKGLDLKLSNFVHIALLTFNFHEKSDEYFYLGGNNKININEGYSICLIEIPKFKCDNIDNPNRREQWLLYLSGDATEDDLYNLVKINPYIKEALVLEAIFQSSEQNFYRYESRQKGIMDRASMIHSMKK